MQPNEINASVSSTLQEAPQREGFTIPGFDEPFEDDAVLEAPQESFENLFNDGDDRNNIGQQDGHSQEQTHPVEQHGQPQEKKKTASSNKRVSQLVHANREKDMALAQANERARQAEERARQAEALLSQGNQENKKQYAEVAKMGLEAQEQLILDRMKTARTTGDMDTEFVLQNDLITNKNVQSSLDRLANEPIQQDKAFSDDVYNNNETYIQPLDVSNDISNYNNYTDPLEFDQPTAQTEFLERNPWFNQNPQLQQEALVIADNMEKQLAFNGQTHLIGTPEYYNVIESTMREQYGFSSGGQVQEQQSQQRQSQTQYQQPVQQKPSYSEGVESRGVTMADQYVQRNPQNTQNAGSLTPEQIRMARNLQIPDPRNRGQTIDANLAIKIAGQAARFHGQQNQGSFSHGGKYSISIPN